MNWNREKKDWDHAISLLFLIMVLAVVFLTFYVMQNVEPGNPLLPERQVTDLSEGWNRSGPGELHGGKTPVGGSGGSTEVYARRLPQDLRSGDILCVETRQQAIRVFLSGQEIYEAGTDSGQRFGKSIGSMWNFVSLPSDAGGQTVTIHLTTAFSQIPNSLQEVVLGQEGAVVLSLLRKNAGVLSFVCFTALLGVLLLILCGVLRLKKLDLGRGQFFYLGVFAILSSVWVLTDSRILQLIISNVAAIYSLSFHTFMLLPVPILLYLRSASRRSTPVPNMLCLLFLVNFAVNTALNMAGIKDLVETLPSTHILMFLGMSWIIFVCARSVLCGREGFSSEVLPALCILCAGAVLSLAGFYGDRPGDYARFFRWGLFLFILTLSLGTVRKGAALLGDSVKAATYKLLAYADTMTMLLNRAAFDRDMEELRKGTGDHRCVSLLLFDLNNLKQTNDTQGHMAGDDMIVRFAESMRVVFEGIGQIYRIGGDEFAVLIYDREDREEKKAAELIGRLKEKCSIDFSAGYAYQELSKAAAANTRELFRTADMRMYQEKAESRKAF